MFFRYWLPFIVWTSLVIILSSLPSFSPPSLGIEEEDLIAHFIIYLIFGFLFLRALNVSDYRRKKVTILLVTGGIFSYIVEYCQNFIPGRYFEISDIISNWSGIILSPYVFKVTNRK